jgi:hypothetical protein
MALRGRYFGDKMQEDGAGDAVGQREDTMSGHRRRVAVAAASLLALLCVGSAYAATPQKIYRDLADGKVDGRYTQAELERALDPLTLTGTDARLPRKPLAETRERQAAPPPQIRTDDRRIPFSAVDGALLVAVGGPLLLIGAGLRRRLSEPRKAQVVGG